MTTSVDYILDELEEQLTSEKITLDEANVALKKVVATRNSPFTLEISKDPNFKKLETAVNNADEEEEEDEEEEKQSVNKEEEDEDEDEAPQIDETQPNN